jgi:hypothetical protein
MAEAKKTLRLSFGTETGTTVSFSFDNPKEGLTEGEITAAMDDIIAKNIFLSTGGDLVEKKDAKIIDTVTTDMYDPA